VQNDQRACRTSLHAMAHATCRESGRRIMLTIVCTQVLSMQCNKIEAVKASIGYCRQLRAVYLKSNPLKKLALSIGALKELSILSYDNAETMAIPPYEVCFVLFCHKAARLDCRAWHISFMGLDPGTSDREITFCCCALDTCLVEHGRGSAAEDVTRVCAPSC
jgi:hypothetical protein